MPTETEDSQAGTATETATETGVGEAVDPTLQINFGTRPADMELAPGPQGGDAPEVWPVSHLQRTKGWIGGGQWPNFVGTIIKRSEVVDGGIAWEVEWKEGFEWHDGEPLTAKDFFWSAEYDFYEDEAVEPGSGELGGNDLPPPDDVDQAIVLLDDYTVRFNFGRPTHPGAFFTGAEPRIGYHHRWVKPTVEKLKDASSPDAAKQIKDEYENAENQSWGPTDYIGHGLYKLENVTEDSMTFEKWEDHPFADRQNIETIEASFVGGDSAARLTFQNNEVDYGRPPKGTDLPNNYTRESRTAWEGVAVNYNQFYDHLAQREVRQAIGFATDTVAIAGNIGGLRPVNNGIYTGLPRTILSVWIPDWGSYSDQLIAYGPGQKLDEAEERMQAAGYSRNSDGKWVDDGGDVLRLAWLGSTDDIGSDAVQANRIQADQLNRFGFETELFDISGDIEPNREHNDRPDEPRQFEWNISHFYSGPDDAPYPATAYQQMGDDIDNGELKIAVDRDGDGEPDDQNYLNRPAEVTIPSESNLGSLDVPGSGRTINLPELSSEIVSPDVSRGRLQELTKLAATYVNFDLPYHCLFWESSSYTADTGDYVVENPWHGRGISSLNNLPAYLALGWFRGKEK